MYIAQLCADVVISEFMADNGTTLTTASGAFSDWIELHNNGTETVDIGGWRIGSSQKTSAGKGWTFPEGTTIPAGSFRLVYADKLNCVTNGELHANFGLSKTGNDDRLWLVDAQGSIRSDFGTYPRQFEDISYGLGHPSSSLVDDTTPCTYEVNGISRSAIGRIGAAASPSGGFHCTRYQINTTVGSVANARSYIANSGRWNGQPVSVSCQTIAFLDNSGTCSFPAALYSPFPGWSATTTDHNNFVVTATASIYIPDPGVWTFSLGSDDGFELSISGNGVRYSTDSGSRSFATTLLQCAIPSAGVYQVDLLYYEQSGGAGCDLSAARGAQDVFSASTFTLVGAADSPLHHADAFSRFIDSDISPQIVNRSTRVSASWPFTLGSAPRDGDTATLTLLYADGCSVSLNGIPVADFNLSPSGEGALAKRSAQEVGTPVTVDVPRTLLVKGANALTIVGHNDDIADGDFLIAPKLEYTSAAMSSGYFRSPTPGAVNAGKIHGPPTPAVTASEPRGYKTAEFNVSLSCPERPDAPIYYTLDGTEPSASSGTRYIAPIRIASTTVLRAVAPDPDSIMERTTSYTWLFMSDILTQSSAPPSGFPASGAVNGHTMRYGLNSAILNSDRARFLNGMTNDEHVATISIATDLANLFDASIGIYTNPRNDGKGWERPVSVEMINPRHGATQEFQINAGLRIRGAASRDKGNPKHSFRLFFREQYGSSRLYFPLFGDEGAESFKKIDLRSEQNHSWHSTGERRNTLVRDVFSRDTQRDMGETAYGRSRYYHLYINGVYWGLYQTEERAEEHFAEDYFGTPKEMWDVIKKDADRTLGCNNGTLDAYVRLFDIAISQGFAGTWSNNYWTVQGLHPDGTKSPSLLPLLNISNLVNYVTITHFTADGDSPVSEWSNFSNNINMLYDETGANGGFMWLHHDSEHSLGAYNGIDNATYGYPANIFDWGTVRDHSDFSKKENMNPLGIHDKLTAHPAYVRFFADAIQRTFFDNGPLTVANAKARIQARMNEIDDAVVGEAARWGNGATRTDWLNACSDVMTFIERRHPILIAQYRAKGWFPTIDAPAPSIENQSHAPLGSVLTLSAGATIYYTTDGSDPMDAAGHPSPTAVRVAAEGAETPSPRTIFPAKSTWSYYDWGRFPPKDASGNAWNAPSFSQSPDWASGPGILGVSGNNGNVVGTATGRYVNHGTGGTQVTTTYFRRDFELSAGEATAKSMTINTLFDDGYVLYVNGIEVCREYMNDGAVGYDTYASATMGTGGAVTQNSYATRTISIPTGLLREGANVIAAEVHQCHGTSTDMYWDCSLATTSASFPPQIVTAQIRLGGNNASIRARAWNGSEWSALADLAYTITAPVQDLSGLRISEIMHAPDKAQNIPPYLEDDFSWIEIVNSGADPLNLFGCSLSGQKFSCTFGDFTISPSERICVTRSAAAFALAHPSTGCRLVEWNEGGEIKRKGDTITLAAPDGSLLSKVVFDNSWFNGATYNTGRSLVVRDTALEQTSAESSSESRWKVGNTPGGTPGLPERPTFLSIRKNGNQFTFEASDLDGQDWALYFTTSLDTAWTLCPATRYTVSNGTIVVTPASRGTTRPLYNAPTAFFIIRPSQP
jgi:hypothetical protein